MYPLQWLVKRLVTALFALALAGQGIASDGANSCTEGEIRIELNKGQTVNPFGLRARIVGCESDPIYLSRDGVFGGYVPQILRSGEWHPRLEVHCSDLFQKGSEKITPEFRKTTPHILSNWMPVAEAVTGIGFTLPSGTYRLNLLLATVRPEVDTEPSCWFARSEGFELVVDDFPVRLPSR